MESTDKNMSTRSAATLTAMTFLVIFALGIFIEFPGLKGPPQNVYDRGRCLMEAVWDVSLDLGLLACTLMPISPKHRFVLQTFLAAVALFCFAAIAGWALARVKYPSD